MGAGNVKAVYGLWGHLPDRPFRLLAFMALTAKDDDQPPCFWGGRETLAVGLGRDVPTGDDAASKRARHAAFEAVRSSLSQLVTAGAIKRTRSASPGRTAKYELILKFGMAQAEPAPNGTGESCPSTQANPAQQGRSILRTAQAEPVPEDYRTDGGLTSGLDRHPSASAPGSANCLDCGSSMTIDGDCVSQCHLPQPWEAVS